MDLLKVGTLKIVPQQAVVCSLLYDHPPLENSLRATSKIVPKLASVFMPQECYCTTCTDSYSMAYPNKYHCNKSKQKMPPWDLFPSSLGNRALLGAHFPLSSNLSTHSSRLLQCVFLTSLSMYMYFSLFPRNPNLHNQLNLMAIISLI
jgi:hypothetical protein